MLDEFKRYYGMPIGGSIIEGDMTVIRVAGGILYKILHYESTVRYDTHSGASFSETATQINVVFAPFPPGISDIFKTL